MQRMCGINGIRDVERNTFQRAKRRQKKSRGKNWQSLRRLQTFCVLRCVYARGIGVVVDWRRHIREDISSRMHEWTTSKIEFEAPHKFYRRFCSPVPSSISLSLFLCPLRSSSLTHSRAGLPAWVRYGQCHLWDSTCNSIDCKFFSFSCEFMRDTRCLPADFVRPFAVVCRIHYCVSSNDHYYCHYIVLVDWAGATTGDAVACLYCHWQRSSCAHSAHTHTHDPCGNVGGDGNQTSVEVISK